MCLYVLLVCRSPSHFRTVEAAIQLLVAVLNSQFHNKKGLRSCCGTSWSNNCWILHTSKILHSIPQLKYSNFPNPQICFKLQLKMKSVHRLFDLLPIWHYQCFFKAWTLNTYFIFLLWKQAKGTSVTLNCVVWAAQQVWTCLFSRFSISRADCVD